MGHCVFLVVLCKAKRFCCLLPFMCHDKKGTIYEKNLHKLSRIYDFDDMIFFFRARMNGWASDGGSGSEGGIIPASNKRKKGKKKDERREKRNGEWKDRGEKGERRRKGRASFSSSWESTLVAGFVVMMICKPARAIWVRPPFFLSFLWNPFPLICSRLPLTLVFKGSENPCPFLLFMSWTIHSSWKREAGLARLFFFDDFDSELFDGLFSRIGQRVLNCVGFILFLTFAYMLGPSLFSSCLPPFSLSGYIQEG
ncbi:hypothetical protein V8C26DRAFT_204064 [Trichoderma gracile]